MRLPQVVIVGRPNVGKSSLFNWLAGRRLAIVDDVAGITRDRVTCVIEAEGRYFELVDTGGVGVNDVDDLSEEIEQQIRAALESADVVVFVTDARTGLAPLDEEVSQRLRRVACPVICVANKADHPGLDLAAEEFVRLGRPGWLAVSAAQDRRKRELLEAIVQALPSAASLAAEAPEAPEMKLAIVGRRNVGKSTFVNALAQTERMIVSQKPGTTRDSVDVRFELDGKAFLAIDTPGLRRRKSIRSDVEFYGLHRAQRSIRRADVVLMLFDAAERVSKVDKQLCQYIAEQYKPCLFVVNKWDLLAGQAATSQWADYLREVFPTMAHVPVAFITAKTGKNIKRVINHAQMLYKQSRRRVSTGRLNRLIQRALEHHPPPLDRGRRPKVFYAAQIGVQPPTVALVCSNPNAFPASYQRYLLGVLREQLDFGECPIRLCLEERSRRRGEAPPAAARRESGGRHEET